MCTGITKPRGLDPMINEGNEICVANSGNVNGLGCNEGVCVPVAVVHLSVATVF